MAAVFAATYPQRCRGLVLYGGFARASSWTTPEGLERFFRYIDKSWGTGHNLPRCSAKLTSAIFCPRSTCQPWSSTARGIRSSTWNVDAFLPSTFREHDCSSCQDSIISFSSTSDAEKQYR